ncbi:MAB_1171c family putative transporter [Gordonia sp. CPCC 205333]|uniref:MAB_1171c family putative transporter n=1 Tax=Gordonia sp. CPCC 205333 TaxID=3140790 RepID=UPI003AF36CFA
MQTDVALGFLLPAVVCWLCSLYCLAWQRDRVWDPAISAILAAFVVRGIASLMGAPHIYHALNAYSGTPNLARLLINASMIVWSVLILTAVAYWSLKRDRARLFVRICWVVVAVVIAASAVLWSTISVPETARGFSDEYAHTNSAVAGLMLIYHLVVSAALIAITLCCIRFAYLAKQAVFRAAMVTTALGAVCYLCFAVHRILVILSHPIGRRLVDPWPTATPLMTGVGTVGMMIGLTMPMWVPELSRARKRLHTNNLHRVLEPLWTDLRPFVSTVPTPDAESNDPEYRLYRRMVDIRDALLALSYRFPVDGDDSERGSARVAQQIRHALDSPDVDASTKPDRSSLIVADRATEERWLTEVAVEYRRGRERQNRPPRRMRRAAVRTDQAGTMSPEP